MNNFKILIPATTANLGPGFDVLGVALNIFNEFQVSLSEQAPMQTGVPAPQIEIFGEGEDILPRDESNLFYRAFSRAFMEVEEKIPAIRLRQHNRIPTRRGLGSSATAIIGGLMAAKQILGEKFPEKFLTKIAIEMEGHPDNVMAAYKGGIVVNYQDDNGDYRYFRIPPPRYLKIVLLIPSYQVETQKAREILPSHYPVQDVIYNMQNLSLVILSLIMGDTNTGLLKLMRWGCRDKIHQPYRAELVPGLYEVIQSADKAGAFGTFLSGSGPTIVAFCSGSKKELEKIASDMQDTIKRINIESKIIITEISDKGARVESVPS